MLDYGEKVESLCLVWLIIRRSKMLNTVIGVVVVLLLLFLYLYKREGFKKKYSQNANVVDFSKRIGSL